MIPGDGEIIEGVASVNESAITGESAPVIREAGGDRSAVTGGTTVLSDWIKVRITAAAGLDLPRPHDRAGRRRRAAEDAERTGAVDPALRPDADLPDRLRHAVAARRLFGTVLSVTVLIALLVCLIPTTIGGLLSAIGIAGMDRLMRFNVIATSGRAVEAAGDVDTLLLDKTGTITFGNRMADEFIPVPGVTERRLAEAALVAEPRRRDAGGPLDRRAGEGRLRPRRAGDPSEDRSCRSPRRPASPASICRAACCARARSTPILAQSGHDARNRRRPSSARRSIASRARAARRSRSPRTAAARRHPPEGHRQARHASASPSCARWASRR